MPFKLTDIFHISVTVIRNLKCKQLKLDNQVVNEVLNYIAEWIDDLYCGTSK